MAENKNIKALTGSTGNAAADVTPRAAWITMCTATASFACVALDADASVIALAGTIAANGAILTAALFDAVIKPRLD